MEGGGRSREPCRPAWVYWASEGTCASFSRLRQSMALSPASLSCHWRRQAGLGMFQEAHGRRRRDPGYSGGTWNFPVYVSILGNSVLVSKKLKIDWTGKIYLMLYNNHHKSNPVIRCVILKITMNNKKLHCITSFYLNQFGWSFEFTTYDWRNAIVFFFLIFQSRDWISHHLNLKWAWQKWSWLYSRV